MDFALVSRHLIRERSRSVVLVRILTLSPGRLSGRRKSDVSLRPRRAAAPSGRRPAGTCRWGPGHALTARAICFVTSSRASVGGVPEHNSVAPRSQASAALARPSQVDNCRAQVAVYDQAHSRSDDGAPQVVCESGELIEFIAARCEEPGILRVGQARWVSRCPAYQIAGRTHCESLVVRLVGLMSCGPSPPPVGRRSKRPSHGHWVRAPPSRRSATEVRSLPAKIHLSLHRGTNSTMLSGGFQGLR